jgi:uncharacterized protein
VEWRAAGRYAPGVRPLDAPPLVHRSLARLRAELERRFGARLRELVLFGSRARGDAHEESDVDVLVVVDALTLDERLEILDLAYDAGTDEGEHLVLAPLVLSTRGAHDLRARGRRIMAEIARDGVPL